MKTKTLTLAAAILMAVLALAPEAQAQKKTGSGGARPAFDVGDNTIGIALGLGNHYNYYSSTVPLPAVVLTYDHGTVGNVGPGTIGIGGILGWQHATYKYGYGGYRSSWTDFVIGVRGTYHLTILKDKNNKFDPYAGVMAGVRIQSWTDDYYDFYGTSYDGGSVNPALGAFIGAKYNFTPNFGAFAEVGYDVAFFKIGLNFNF